MFTKNIYGIKECELDDKDAVLSDDSNEDTPEGKICIYDCVIYTRNV